MQQESSTDLTKERAASLCPWKLPELLPCASGNFYNCFLCSWKLPELFSVFLDISRAASLHFWTLPELFSVPLSAQQHRCFLSLPAQDGCSGRKSCEVWVNEKGRACALLDKCIYDLHTGKAGQTTSYFKF